MDQEPKHERQQEEEEADNSKQPNSVGQEKELKPRLIVRLGIFLASHHVLFSAVCCVAGFVALLFLPALSVDTHISENALLPGSANPVFSRQAVIEANRFMRDIEKIAGRSGDRMGVPKFIGQRMEDVGAEVYHHSFLPATKHFHPLHFFISTRNTLGVQTNSSRTYFGTNTVGIIRAPRGDGKEAIVFVSPYNSQNIKPDDALSLGLAFSIFSLLSRATWLAKDIVWLAADSQFGEHDAVSTWLNDYHDPMFLSDTGVLYASLRNAIDIQNRPNDAQVEGANVNAFKRAGTISAAFIFKVAEKKENDNMDSLKMSAEASNGQMPNLDLLNVVHYLAVHRQGFRVNIDTFSSLLNSALLKCIAEALQSLGGFARTLNPQLKFDATVNDYVEGTANLVSSLYNQAIGVPTGSHGAFRDYQIDAVSLEFSPILNPRNENARSAFLLKGGRLIEGVVRSMNNLLEKFHHSYFLYFLTAPNKFISVGVYMIPFALLVVPLPIVAVALSDSTKTKEGSMNDDHADGAKKLGKLVGSGDADNAKTKGKSMESKTDGSKIKGKPIGSCKTKELEIGTGSWKWLQAARVLLIVQLWAVIVSLLPYYISHIPNTTPSLNMLIWTVLSICTLVIMYLIFGSPYSTNAEWELLKGSTIAATSIGLGLMSIINFATAQIGAVLLVPMCLFARPLKTRAEMNFFIWMVLLICNTTFAVVGFPPTALLIVRGLSEGFDKVNIGDFWVQMEFLWKWSSATYLYLLLVHLPCWLLCIHVMLHPRHQAQAKHESIKRST